MQRKGIVFDLQYGDKKRIAEGLGCAPVTVQKVLAGERSAKTPLGERIIKAAELLVEHQQQGMGKLREITRA